MTDWNRNPNRRRGGRTHAPRRSANPGPNKDNYFSDRDYFVGRRHSPRDIARGGGPFHEGYDSGFIPEEQKPRRNDNRRPWQGGMEENRYSSWEYTGPERPVWEQNESFREYNRNISNLPGFYPGERRSEDEDIRGDIYQLLSSNPYIFAPDINVMVRDGRVRLEGVVRDEHLWEMAGSIARMVAGVRSVDNRLEIWG